MLVWKKGKPKSKTTYVTFGDDFHYQCMVILEMVYYLVYHIGVFVKVLSWKLMKTMVIRTPNESAVMISQASDGFCYSGVLFALATCDHSAYRTSSPWYSGISPWIQMKYLIYVCYVVIQFGVYRLIGSFKDLLLISRCRPPCLPGPSAVSKFKQCVYIVLGRIVAKNSTPTMLLDNHLACWLVPPIPQSLACSQVPYTTSVVHHDDFVTRVS